MLDNCRINLVVAHAVEAKPLCSMFGLRAQAQSAPFPVFQNDSGLSLIVSGMGKSAVAAATGYLAGLQVNLAKCAWLNVGIAGHPHAEIGAGLLAHKITDAGNGNKYYPPQLLAGLPTTAVVTVDQPEHDYPENAAYEMEAAGFYHSASRVVTTELVQVFKVISDNPGHPIARFEISQVKPLLQAQAPQLQQLLTDLGALLDSYRSAYALPGAFHELSQRQQFTATQRVQLQRLCERYQALGLSNDLDAFCEKSFSTSRQLLAELEIGLSGQVAI